MMSKRHWLIAGCVAIFIHGIVFYTVFYQPLEGSKAPGDQGVQFDLGMIGDMGAAAQTRVAQQEAVTAPKTNVEPIEEPEKEVPDIVEEQKSEEIEEKTVVIKEPKPDTVEKPELVIKPKPPVVVKQTSPIVMPKVKPKKKQDAPLKSIDVKTTQKDTQIADAKPINKGPVSKANQKATTGQSHAATTGGHAGAKAKYFTLLASALAQSKRYPRASRRRNEEGVVTLSFMAYANGGVSDAKIIKSSGHHRLDKAVLDMLKRAVPLPRFSDDMTEKSLKITLPVSFQLSD
ncbi:energy transducer TonB [Marinomonas sp. TI.3.20]|uniref:energy transducer TonB n=1 Tax=Marinomonas sp. TI.3.20 TaxID=3121296 RepID=UPI00311F49C0